MKSVWTIPPPESWEKKFGKHPAQKPVALLERILLASSNEGDLVLDPFLGSGTTLIAALRLSRFMVGIEADGVSVDLACARICSELVLAMIFVDRGDSPVDPRKRSVDRSEVRTMAHARKLVRKECSFYFVGAHQRDVIFSVVAESMDEAWQKFFASSRAATEVMFVIKTWLSYSRKVCGNIELCRLESTCCRGRVLC
jgi:hypothetical protein